MAFFESQFPTNALLNGFSWNPFFHNTNVGFGSGSQQRNKDWSTPLGMGHFDYFCDETLKNTIQAFFMNVAGGFDGFRAKIWADYSLTSQLLGVSDGSTTIFQIYKTYTTGARSLNKNIYKPITGITMVEGATFGAAVSFTNFTVSTTTGLLTLTAQPTTGHSMWITGSFDTPVLMTDELQISNAGNDNQYQVKFDFQEIREVT